MMRSPDVLCVAGLAMIGYGLWIVHPSLMLVVMGGVLVSVGVWSHIRSTRTKQEQTK